VRAANQKVVDATVIRLILFCHSLPRDGFKSPDVSLKGYVPALPAFGISPAALYERQRALVRSGAMDLIEAAGRERCPRGLPRNCVAVIAVLATDSLSQTEQRVQEIGNAEVVNSLTSPRRS